MKLLLFASALALCLAIGASCGVDEFQCRQSQKCIPKSKVCDFLTDCTSNNHMDFSDESACASCNFEEDECGWKDASRGNYAWKRVLTDDHSATVLDDKEKGYAMVLTRKPGTFYSTTVLKSPELGPTGKPCTLQFFYKKQSVCSGVNKEELQIWTVNGSTKKKIWSECKGSSSGWNHASVPVPQVARGFHLEFRLAAMRGPTGVVAIDDITMGLCGKDMRGFKAGWGF